MKRRVCTILLALTLAVSLAACDTGEETTLTGMVVSVDGTVVSLMEMNGNMSGMNFGSGAMPRRPEGMEDFREFGNLNPEDFSGMFPGGENFPQWGNGEMPELPEGMTMPGFGGEKGGMGFDFENFDSDAQTQDLDVGDAHISVEIDGGKASGSMEDITAGAFVTITLNAKGKATNVVVSSRSSFGGGRWPTT